MDSRAGASGPRAAEAVCGERDRRRLSPGAAIRGADGERRAWALLAAVVALTPGTVWPNVRLSLWDNSFHNTLQKHDLARFCCLATHLEGPRNILPGRISKCKTSSFT